MTDFVNLKIKSDQYFRYVHKNKLYVRIFIKLSAVYEYPRVTAVLWDLPVGGWLLWRIVRGSEPPDWAFPSLG
jgi:hypothetical protein